MHKHMQIHTYTHTQTHTHTHVHTAKVVCNMFCSNHTSGLPACLLLKIKQYLCNYDS